MAHYTEKPKVKKDTSEAKAIVLFILTLLTLLTLFALLKV